MIGSGRSTTVVGGRFQRAPLVLTSQLMTALIAAGCGGGDSKASPPRTPTAVPSPPPTQVAGPGLMGDSSPTGTLVGPDGAGAFMSTPNAVSEVHAGRN